MYIKRPIILITAACLLATANVHADHHATGASNTAAMAQEHQSLVTLLNWFLQQASYGGRDAHERFWHEALIYTSSNGTRTTKPEILAGMPETADQPAAEPATIFTSADVQIRMLGKNSAVIAFKLIATPNQKAEQPAPQVNYYFNTGTFTRENGEWRAIAWQATSMAE
ncbi:MAG: nuclear transport factor 2 family protein [Pseudomonadota bacterium]